MQEEHRPTTRVAPFRNRHNAPVADTNKLKIPAHCPTPRLAPRSVALLTAADTPPTIHTTAARMTVARTEHRQPRSKPQLPGPLHDAIVSKPNLPPAHRQLPHTDIPPTQGAMPDSWPLLTRIRMRCSYPAPVLERGSTSTLRERSTESLTPLPQRYSRTPPCEREHRASRLGGRVLSPCGRI